MKAPKSRPTTVTARKAVLPVGASLGLHTAVALLAAAGLWRALAPEPERRLPPEPRLQDHPETELAEMRAAEAHQMDSYAWEDESRGIARVPIERAMQMVAENGVPTWPEVDANGEPVESNAGGGQ